MEAFGKECCGRCTEYFSVRQVLDELIENLFYSRRERRRRRFRHVDPLSCGGACVSNDEGPI